MLSKIIFSICVFLAAYYLPIIFFKGVRKQPIYWFSLLPFALGVAGIVLFFCNIY